MPSSPDLRAFDLIDPGFLQDPYPFYKILRSEHPLYWHESGQSLGLWLATRYEDVRAFLRDPRLSSGGGRGSTTLRAIPPEDRKTHADFLDFYNKWVLLTDPPEHTRLRKLTNKGFTPSHVGRLEPFMKGLAEGLLNALPHGEPVDFMSRFAHIMPAMVILEILGIPQKDREKLVNWSNDVAVLIGLGQITLDILKRVRRSYMAMTEYFTQHIEDIRANPMENVLSTLTQAVEEGDRLSTAELYAQAVVLMIGGHETTRNLIGSGLYLFLKNPEQFAQLHSDQSLLDRAIEECLRYESPVQFVGRSAKEDIQHQGKTIRKGQMIMLMIGSANRDPEAFPEPERFNIVRTPNKHLSFGLGLHYCLGAPLARVQTRIVFDALLQRFNRIRLVEEPQWAPSPVFRGPTQLVVELEH